ncbi:NHL repeat-containing protein [Acanthamoeba castellanii str. Neff]|uniref:NHL repeat-containing protein n=1 Tax=Acanthamoeba castellanii (strain ATCC 30010 / Neff) TaxID=1257118 RepID=L8HJ95_ACACF|nr:NHL repeat-containing protein [Acanthamoeba castellanii str. Neff]ELR25292.1 NHL repeat-containing protein [Acanthamoeba castellanii str. Neff]
MEYKYLDEVDETLECMVCHEPLVDPVVEPNCRVTFCRRCVSPWVAEKHSCPSCRGATSVAQLHPAPRIITHATADTNAAISRVTSNSVPNLAAHVLTCPLAPLRPFLLRMQALEAEVAQLRPFRLRTQALEAEVAKLKRALRPRGRFVRAWGTRGSADAQFSAPCGLAIAQGQGGGLVVVADHNNHRVQVFDAEGRLRAKFGGEGSALGRFYHPRGVATLAVGGGGRLVVLVADRDNHRVQVFDDQGRVQSAFGTQGRRHGQLEQPWGVAVDPQRGHAVFVSDSGNHRVQAFDLQGNHLHSFGAQGDQPGQLQQPCGIAVDRRRGLVWVADTDNHRVQVFDGQGRFLRGFGGEGAGEGRFQFPRDIVVVDGDDDDDDDSTTRVYVTDNHRVQMFDGHGWFLGAIGREGRAEGCFDHPRGVAVDSQGRVFVADSANHRVQVFTFGK